MATLTLPNTFSPNTTILSAAVNSNFTTIYNDYNGNITNANIAAGAAIALSKLASVPRVAAFSSSNPSIANNTVTYLTFDSEDHDTDTMHSTVSNTGRLTATTAGVYLIVASANWKDAAAAGLRAVGISRNAARTNLAYVQTVGTAGQTTYQQAVIVYPLNAGDYVEMWVQQNSGGALVMDAGTWPGNTNVFQATYVGKN